MIDNKPTKVKRDNQGSSFSLRAHGLGGASATFTSFLSFQSAEGGQRGREATALFCFSRKAKRKNFRSLIVKILSGARIKKYVENFSFLLLQRQAEWRRRRAGSLPCRQAGAPLRAQNSVQKRFALRSVIATKCNFHYFWGKTLARSPCLRLGSLRKFLYILGLNQMDEQNQKSVFCPAGGGSACEARNKMNILYPIFSFPPLAEYEASFCFPRFRLKATY